MTVHTLWAHVHLVTTDHVAVFCSFNRTATPWLLATFHAPWYSSCKCFFLLPRPESCTLEYALVSCKKSQLHVMLQMHGHSAHVIHTCACKGKLDTQSPYDTITILHDIFPAQHLQAQAAVIPHQLVYLLICCHDATLVLMWHMLHTCAFKKEKHRPREAYCNYAVRHSSRGALDRPKASQPF